MKNSISFHKQEMNVLHLVKSSFPSISGYTIRTNEILTHQKEFVNPLAITSPYFLRKNKNDIINKNIYLRFPDNPLWEIFYENSLFKKFKISLVFNNIYNKYLGNIKHYIENIVKKYDIRIIHGHTPFMFSQYGNKIAKKIDLKFLYEVRGFWEDTFVETSSLSKRDKKYTRIKKNETELMESSDIVVTLSETMKNEISKRRIDPNKIYIVPNGVNSDKFYSVPRNEELIKRLGIKAKSIIGYIGSIRKIEGLEYLIRAIAHLRENGKKVEAVLVGNYETSYYQELFNTARELDILKYIHFLGKIPFNKIKDYYSIIDIFVLPRINKRVCRLVTPLKQLEAMAMEKVVITSDLPALREVIKEGVSGDFFQAENYVSLANRLKLYIENIDLRKNLGKKAREYVINNFDWKKIIYKYKNLYESLL